MNNADKIRTAETEAAAMLEAGAALGATPEVQRLDLTSAGRPFMVKPKDLDIHDFSQWMPAPQRLIQNVTLLTPDALIRYVNLFGSTETTIVFADRGSSTFRAVLDYHAAPDKPSWGSHTASCVLKHTQPWLEWGTQNNKFLTQDAFARFLEEHIPDIVVPDAASIVEMVRKFDAVKIVAFKSHTRADNNTVKFMYDEEIKDSTRAGEVKIPVEFQINLAPYEGTGKRRLVARLRYQMTAQELKLKYELVRAQDELDLSFAEIFEHIGGHTREHCRAVILGSLL